MVIMDSPKACVYNTPVVIILIVQGNYGIYCCRENIYSLPCGIYGELIYYENVQLMLVSVLGSIFNSSL